MIKVILTTKSGMVVKALNLEHHDPFPDIIVIKEKHETRYYYFAYSDPATCEEEKEYIYYEGHILLVKE